MKIAALAAGGVGGYFGARLAAAGHDVTFIARGAHLEAIRRDGLQIESPLGNLHVRDAQVTSAPAEVGPVDVVLFAVKLWDTEIAGEAAKPLIGPHTRLLTLQNGVDSVERLAPIIGVEHVVGGVAYIATVIGAPGVIQHTGQFAIVRCGRPGNAPDPQLGAFVEAGKVAGIDIALSQDIEVERWKKFAFLASMAAATGGTRHSIGPILADADTRAFFVSLLSEVTAVARAKGVALPADFVEERMRFAETVHFGMKASLLHDLERGNRLELDWLTGRVVALGRELGVPTPSNEAAYAMLKLHRMGAPR
jgi:2-dehydropantoate 2-reductase